MPAKLQTADPGLSQLELGRRIRAARLSRGLTQRALSRPLSLSYQQIQKYERGDSAVSVSMLLQIAAVMKMPAYDLIAGLGSSVTNGDMRLTSSERSLVEAFRMTSDEGRRAVEQLLCALLKK